MFSRFPKFSERIATLIQVLDRAFKKRRERTKKNIPKMILSTLHWTKGYVLCFHDIQRKLYENVKLE